MILVAVEVLRENWRRITIEQNDDAKIASPVIPKFPFQQYFKFLAGKRRSGNHMLKPREVEGLRPIHSRPLHFLRYLIFNGLSHLPSLETVMLRARS